MTPSTIDKVWRERGEGIVIILVSSLETRQEDWFHNGDGSAQQRYFYNQYEMLDMHGGLECIPMSVGDKGEVCVTGVTSL